MDERQLFSEIEVGQYGPVPFDVRVLKIVQQPLALSNKGKKALLCREIFFVLFQMLGKMVDAVREEGNLRFCGSGFLLFLSKAVLCKEALFDF